MSSEMTRASSLTSQQVLRERCAALGLAVWRCDNTGLVLADPEETGPAGMLWGASVLNQLISDVARRWGTEEHPDVVEIFEGAYAIPLPERRRKQRTGCWVCLGLSPGALVSDHIDLACNSAQLDARAVRRLLLPRARFDMASARNTRETLEWMAGDLRANEEGKQTIAGFTRELTEAYETVSMLYSLGRSMSDLTDPPAFLRTICQKAKSTLAFGWVGAMFLPTARLSRGLAGTSFFTGPHGCSPAGLDRTVRRLLNESPERAANAGTATILSEIDGTALRGNGQILLHPILRGAEPIGVILAGDKGGEDPQVSSYDIQLLQAAAGYFGSFLDNTLLYEDQRSLFLGTLEALTAAIDAKDPYTRGHSQRVAHLSNLLALAIGLTPGEAERVRIAGLVHDVGKIGVPEAVLGKAGRLSEEEFVLIRKHPETGHRILRDIGLLSDILPAVLHHHERWDGRGYPAAIGGDAIPLYARIIAMADTFDAMSSNRSYRAAMPREKVFEEIARSSGTQFDPRLTGPCVHLDFAEYDRMVAMERGVQEDLAVARAAA